MLTGVSFGSISAAKMAINAGFLVLILTAKGISKVKKGVSDNSPRKRRSRRQQARFEDRVAIAHMKGKRIDGSPLRHGSPIR